MDKNGVVSLLSLEADSSSFSTKDLRQMVDNFTHLVETIIPKDILSQIKVKVREGSQAIDLIADKQTKLNLEIPYQYIANFINEKNSFPEKINIKAAKYIQSICKIKSNIFLFTNLNTQKKINFDKSLSEAMNKSYLSKAYEATEMGIVEGIIHSIADTKAEKFNQIKIEERVSRKIIPCVLENEHLIQKIIDKKFYQKLVVITGIIYYSKLGECKKIKVKKIEAYRESFGL